MSLKEGFASYFKVGAAISREDMGIDSHMALLKREFNSFTCENDMKPMFFLDWEENLKNPKEHDTRPAVTLKTARPYLEFAKENNFPMRGHTLVWHNQTPKWFFFRNYDVKGELADRELMLTRLESYIASVLGMIQAEYPGVIYAWDVVNEAVDEGEYRKKSLWYETVGSDFIFHAFRFARKYAQPGVKLFYNDYETSLEWKRDFIIENILRPLMEQKLLDGMGLQSHLLMDHPDLGVYRESLERYGALGLEIQITELDMHNADPGEASMHQLALRYKEVFRIYLEAKQQGKANITSVTFWNLLDESSWLTGFRRETSYPLLFHGECETKEAYDQVMSLVQ